MKKALILIGLAFIFWGCATDVEQLEQELAATDFLSYTLAVSIAEEQVVQTRAQDKESLQIAVLLFNGQKQFLSLHPVLVKRQLDALTFEIELSLPKSKEKRSLHFLANYSEQWWSEHLSEAHVHSLLMQSEQTVLSSLKSTSGPFYWGSIAVDALQTSSDLKGKKIGLIAHQAQIKLTHSAASFELLSFDVHKKSQEGYIVGEPFVSLSTDARYQAYSGDQLSTQAGVFTSNYYLFPKNNQYTNSRASIILKASYKGQEGFYKLDLIDKNTGEYIDFHRNHIYHIHIQMVTSKGYSSLQDALKNPASNNLYYDVESQHLPSISDGLHTLSVDKVGALVMKQNFQHDIVVEYSHGNHNVVAAWLDNPERSSNNGDFIYHPTNIVGFRFYPDAKKLHVWLMKRPAKPQLFKLLLRTTDGSNLTRVLPYYVTTSYTRTDINFKTSATYQANQGDECYISFDVPEDMLAVAFPFYVYIQTNVLDPIPGQAMDISYDKQTNYFPYAFRYKVTDSMKGTRQTLRFRYNQSLPSTTNPSQLFVLESQYFDTIRQ